MNEKSSGIYVIDSDYNVVSCNQTVLELYPQLKKGKKCYKCLMGLDEPCPPCPVANHVNGPRTYLDPIRGIHETVDAVEMVLEDGSVGHALVMSTVGERATISSKLPESQDELDRLLEHEYFDALTGEYSRKGFIRETQHIFQREDQQQYAVVMFDIRNFKAINDVFGIQNGDLVLQNVFRTLKDSWMNPVVSARIESDWFIFLVRKRSLSGNDLADLLDLTWENGTQHIHVHLRCGIYNAGSEKYSVSRMVDWAILAKEAADRSEHSSVGVFDSAMRSEYVNRAEILSSFQSSLKKGEMQVFYQPIFRCDTGQTCSAEALIRWDHPSLGIVSPGDFIPALEKHGFVSQLDHYVLKEVYRFQNSRIEQGLDLLPVSMNLSRQDFYNDALMHDIFLYGSESRLPRGSVNYEVTETSLAVLRENCAYYLSQFRKNGSRILLDDFGTGYSALGMIGNYPLDVVKIDKSFIQKIETQPTTRSVISSMITMCHRTGLATVAEGVETREQSDFLKKNHCDFVRGYYYSRPMSEDDFCSYLQSHSESISREDCLPSDHVERDLGTDDLMDLLDHSGQFIQVCHPEDYTMVYANQMTLDISGHPDRPYQGEKCYQYMLGLNAPCGHCPMKQMGDEKEKDVETDDGEHVFRLKARYAEWNGKKVFIEYGRDVTGLINIQRRYTNQIRGILETIPDGQGVFHMDLTADRWLSSGGNAENARKMQNMGNVDALIHQIASFVPSDDGQELFFQTFCRQAQLAAWSEDRHQITLETESYYDDMSIRWSRITTQLIENPSNGHVESILYGVDISKESRHIEELERDRLHIKQEKEMLQKQVEMAMSMYSKADHDRRYDFLTGLFSRLSLYDVMRDIENGTVAPVTAAILLDLDNFKVTNDKYGHAAGDRCLQAMGDTLLNFGLKWSISFYRYGGDEFVGLISGTGDDLPSVVSALLDEIRGIRVVLDDGTEIRVSASIGYTTATEDLQNMINKADDAMYMAKNRGKDQTACSD